MPLAMPFSMPNALKPLHTYARWLLLAASLSLAHTAMSQNPTQPTATPPAPSEPIYLWQEKPLVTPDREYSKDQRIYAVDNPSITPYWPAQPNGTAVVIFPGGGYVRLAIPHEGYAIAQWFAERGVTAFVVKYRMAEYGAPAPLQDAQRALRLVRSKAAQWHINPNKIGVIGFSAGGHVAASLATRHRFTAGEADILAEVSARPDFAILGYPVITLEGPDAHAGSRKALLGEAPSAQQLRDNSLQYQVTADIPPTFILHGTGDQSVPVSNSLAFFAEVQKYNQQSELHVYQSHIHGVGMTKKQGTISSWPEALERWLTQNQFL